MDHLEAKNEAFYQNLALIYYAMGMSDKKFVREEKLAIIGLIKKTWLQETGGIDVEQIMYAALKKHIASKMTAEQAFAEFRAHYELNPVLYSTLVRKQIIEDVYEIASSFANRNKSELVLFSQIMNLFFPSN